MEVTGDLSSFPFAEVRKPKCSGFKKKQRGLETTSIDSSQKFCYQEETTKKWKDNGGIVESRKSFFVFF